jgi:hypothetical protein
LKFWGVTNLLPLNESRPRDSNGLEKKLENSVFNSSSLFHGLDWTKEHRCKLASYLKTS